MSQESKVALVIGVGPGLGSAAARRLAADGYRVAIASRDAAKLADLATELDGLALSIDATAPASIEAGIAEVEAELDRAGWRVLIIWECSLKGTGRIGIDRVVPLAADWLRSGERVGEIRGTVRASG